MTDTTNGQITRALAVYIDGMRRAVLDGIDEATLPATSQMQIGAFNDQFDRRVHALVFQEALLDRRVKAIDLGMRGIKELDDIDKADLPPVARTEIGRFVADLDRAAREVALEGKRLVRDLKAVCLEIRKHRAAGKNVMPLRSRS